MSLVARLVGSTIYTSHNTSDIPPYRNIDSETFSTITHDDTAFTGYYRVGGFDFSIVPQNATIVSFRALLKMSANNPVAPGIRPFYNGGSALDINQVQPALSKNVKVFEYPATGMSWSDFSSYGSNLRVNIPVDTDNTIYLYGVEIEVTYDLPCNKVVYGTTVLVDLTADTVTPESLLEGYTAHDKSGALITGTATGGGTGGVTQDGEGYIVLPDQGGGGGATVTLKMGVIRPDAELVQKWTYDRMVVADDGIALPEYSTTAYTLIASENLTPTVQIDTDANDYVALERYLIIPSYSSDTISKGRFAGYAYYRAAEIYTQNAFISDGGTTAGGRTSRQLSAVPNAIYWSSAIDLSNTPQHVGIYINNNGYTISNDTLTYKSPNLVIRGNTTYFTSANWSNLTDIRYQYVIEFYKVEKGSLNIDGFVNGQLDALVTDCFNSPSHTLI